MNFYFKGLPSVGEQASYYSGNFKKDYQIITIYTQRLNLEGSISNFSLQTNPEACQPYHQIQTFGWPTNTKGIGPWQNKCKPSQHIFITASATKHQSPRILYICYYNMRYTSPNTPDALIKLCGWKQTTTVLQNELSQKNYNGERYYITSRSSLFTVQPFSLWLHSLCPSRKPI